MTRSISVWRAPFTGVIIYPGFLLAFDWAISGFHRSQSPPMAVTAVLAMLLAGAVPVLSARALLSMRHETGAVVVRGMLYLMFAVPSLFTLTLTLTRLAGITQRMAQLGIWIVAWLAIGLMLQVRGARQEPATPERPIRWLRIVHGGAALCLLCGFLLAHLANHLLAVSSVDLHRAAMDWLRIWYRSNWVEPVLLVLLLVMLGTGVPMVLRYSRQCMDAFRVVQTATGAYIAVFICSHVTAVLTGRRLGLETDWYFAAGPDSLLAGTSLLGRLIPHYACATLFFIVHVACGLRVVLLQHGVPEATGNRALYALTGIGTVVMLSILAALSGWHLEPAG